MIKVSLDLSELEIHMLINCIESALDTKHISEEGIKRVIDIRKQLEKHLPS